MAPYISFIRPIALKLMKNSVYRVDRHVQVVQPISPLQLRPALPFNPFNSPARRSGASCVSHPAISSGGSDAPRGTGASGAQAIVGRLEMEKLGGRWFFLLFPSPFPSLRVTPALVGGAAAEALALRRVWRGVQSRLAFSPLWVSAQRRGAGPCLHGGRGMEEALPFLGLRLPFVELQAG